MSAIVNMSVFGGPSLSTKGGRRATLKRQIFQLMADGRERTTADICRALSRTGSSYLNSTGEALRNMAEQGLLSRDDSLGIAIWRKESFHECTQSTPALPHIPEQGSAADEGQMLRM